MADSVHSHPLYRFYLQRYPEGDTTYPVIDIEAFFNCYYQSMTNNGQTAVKNYYEESWVEHNGSRLWLPKTSDDIAFDTSELTLSLLFKSNENYEVLSDEKRFLEYITAKRFEYHDTFRPNRYWQLTFVAAPETKQEILYGNRQYRLVSFNLKNWGGKYYTSSQL